MDVLLKVANKDLNHAHKLAFKKKLELHIKSSDAVLKN